MPTILPLALAALIAAAPPAARQAPPWIQDAATQILARAMLDEARARTGRTSDVVPTREDMVRALTRCLENTDNLLLLSGLVPKQRAVAAARPAPEPKRRGIRLSELEAAEAAGDRGRF